MKVTSLAKVMTFLAAIALVASAGTAQAQVNKADASCRSAIMKVSTKLAQTVSKGVDGCFKECLKNGCALNCGDAADYDLKGKSTKAIQKLKDTVGGAKSKCGVKDPNVLALAEFGTCPSPGTQGVVVDFSDVGDCNAELNEAHILTSASYILDPDFAAIQADDAKAIGKCGNTIRKGVTGIIKTVGKERGKCQTTSDKGGGSYDFTCSTAGAAKIGGAIAKLEAGIDKSCTALSSAQLALLGPCGPTIGELKACAASSARKAASGLVATSFEYEGVCPSSVIVDANAGYDASAVKINTTRLDAGFTGFGQDTEIIEGFVGHVNLTCSDATCGSCSVTTNCAQGNCRCDNDVTIICDEPFGPDADDCGGADCNVLFGPPLPSSASGTPVCIVTEISSELVGTADVGTGSSSTDVISASKVHTGITGVQPCPTCVAGSCVGGDRDTLGCSVDATSVIFGDVSYDCPPDPVTNVSGTGLQLTLGFSDAASSLPAATACDFPLGALSCHCAQCSGDTTIACVDDAECAAAAAGTCTSSTGASRAPNGCSGFACTADADGVGTCDTGPDDMYCDGVTKSNGDGIATCSSNLDCTPALGGGTCAITSRRKCFDDPITASGDPGIDGAELAGTFCIPPTASAAINGAAGTTGPGRLRIDWDFTGLCSDGVTEYELGGSNCP